MESIYCTEENFNDMSELFGIEGPLSFSQGQEQQEGDLNCLENFLSTLDDNFGDIAFSQELTIKREPFISSPPRLQRTSSLAGGGRKEAGRSTSRVFTTSFGGIGMITNSSISSGNTPEDGGYDGCSNENSNSGSSASHSASRLPSGGRRHTFKNKAFAALELICDEDVLRSAKRAKASPSALSQSSSSAAVVPLTAPRVLALSKSSCASPSSLTFRSTHGGSYASTPKTISSNNSPYISCSSSENSQPSITRLTPFGSRLSNMTLSDSKCRSVDRKSFQEINNRLKVHADNIAITGSGGPASKSNFSSQPSTPKVAPKTPVMESSSTKKQILNTVKKSANNTPRAIVPETPVIRGGFFSSVKSGLGLGSMKKPAVSGCATPSSDSATTGKKKAFFTFGNLGRTNSGARGDTSNSLTSLLGKENSKITLGGGKITFASKQEMKN